MENKSGNVKTAMLVITFMLVLGTVGCESKKTDSDIIERKAIIDDYAKIILLQDRDSADFDKTLSAVGAYIDNRTTEQKAAAMEALAGTIEQMETDSAECESYEISEEFGQILEKHQISRVEYQMNADSRYTYLQDYIQDLTFLTEYVTYSDEGEAFMEDLQMTYRFMEEEQQLMRAYNYTGINYWFAGWGEEETEYIRQEVFDKLVSFSAEDVQWEDSRDAVEASMNACLDQVEALYNEWTAYIGESWEELNQMQ